MPRIKIRLPRSRKGFVSIKSIRELNPNLQVVEVRKRFKLKKLR